MKSEIAPRSRRSTLLPMPPVERTRLLRFAIALLLVAALVLVYAAFNKQSAIDGLADQAAEQGEYPWGCEVVGEIIVGGSGPCLDPIK
jgi:hypothetical protein